LPSEYVHRGYEIWRHAKKKIIEAPSDLDRIDCISSLKRAVNHRIKSITDAYAFSELPSVHGRKKTLEKLQEYGLVRPAIIQDLFDVRNIIEHNDADPPDLKKCEHYVDIVWYFLKSTDDILRYIKDGPTYTCFDGGWRETAWVSVSPIIEKDWKFPVTAKLPPSMTRVRKPSSKFIEISDCTVRRKVDKERRAFITGFLNAEGNLLRSIVRDHFALSGFWYEDHAI